MFYATETILALSEYTVCGHTWAWGRRPGGNEHCEQPSVRGGSGFLPLRGGGGRENFATGGEGVLKGKNFF